MRNAQPWISARWFTALFEQMVPQDIRETDYNADTGEWTDEGYVKALALMQEMQNKGYLNDNINSMTDDQAAEVFAAGMGGMFYTGLYNFDPMDEKMGSENWDWFPFPSLEDAVGRTNTVVGASDLFIVSSQSEHPEVAVDFLKFLTSKENQTRLPAETWLTPVVEGSSTQDNSSAKELDFIEYVANESNGFSEYLDTATDARVCDVLLENFQLLYDGKAPEEIMKEVQQIAKTVREEG
ncbi:MAG: ABC transporter substrate-binding protein [Ruthenibacterium lactatiformans]